MNYVAFCVSASWGSVTSQWSFKTLKWHDRLHLSPERSRSPDFISEESSATEMPNATGYGEGLWWPPKMDFTWKWYILVHFHTLWIGNMCTLYTDWCKYWEYMIFFPTLTGTFTHVWRLPFWLCACSAWRTCLSNLNFLRLPETDDGQAKRRTDAEQRLMPPSCLLLGDSITMHIFPGCYRSRCL